MMNSGSYFVFMMLILIRKMSYFGLNYICTKFPNNRLARLLGMRVFSPHFFQDWWQATFKLFIEGYFDISICALLNLYAFYQVRDDIGQL